MIHTQYRIHPSRGVRGFTLVEVMVAGTLALILLTALLTILMAAKESYNTNEALARMQENYRFTHIMLRRHMSPVGIEPLTSTFTPYNLGALTSGLNAASSADNISPTPDTVALDMYFGGSKNCAGSGVSGWGANTFTVDPDRHILTCNGHAIAEGVKDLQALYGVDDDHDGNVDFYTSLGNIISAGQVMSVRVQLTITDTQSVDDALSDRAYISTIAFANHAVSNTAMAFSSLSAVIPNSDGVGVMTPWTADADGE